jgi:hypothetical protein
MEAKGLSSGLELIIFGIFNLNNKTVPPTAGHENKKII